MQCKEQICLSVLKGGGASWGGRGNHQRFTAQLEEPRRRHYRHIIMASVQSSAGSLGSVPVAPGSAEVPSFMCVSRHSEAHRCQDLFDRRPDSEEPISCQNVCIDLPPVSERHTLPS